MRCALQKVMAFTNFCEKVLKLTLTPGQRALCRVAFDGVPISALEGVERDLALQMFGDVDDVSDAVRRILVLVLGRGSGKTTIASAYGVYVALTADVSKCGPGDIPVAVTIAPDKKTAQLSVRMALEMVQAIPSLAKLLQSDAADGFTLRRPDGRLVAFEAFAASRGGSSARGRSILSFILDEAQFFRSDDAGAFVVNDRDIFRALVPRLMPGGRGVFISTPWPCETLMGELFAKNHGTPTTALAAKAPTTLMRDDESIAKTVEAERERDPENAAREFDCDTSLSSGGGFFDAAAISAAVDPTPLPLPFTPGHRYAAAGDFAFKRDSSALVIAAFDGTRYRVAAYLEKRPKPGAPLKPSVVVAEFAELLHTYGLTTMMADEHCFEAVHEHLTTNKIALVPAPAGLNGKFETYSRARSVLHEGKAGLPDVPRFLAQLRAVVSRPAPGGAITISSPRRTGEGHGDICSAWVLAVHQLAFTKVKHGAPRDETYAERMKAAHFARIQQRNSGKPLRRTMTDHARDLREAAQWRTEIARLKSG